MHLHCSFIAKPLPHPRHNLERSRTTKMPAFQAKAWRRSKISCHDICSPTGSEEHLRVRLMIITIIIFGITNRNTKIPLPETDLTTSLAPPATRSSNPPSESERLTKCRRIRLPPCLADFEVHDDTLHDVLPQAYFTIVSS